jgi:signal transduction histidine kinase
VTRSVREESDPVTVQSAAAGAPTDPDLSSEHLTTRTITRWRLFPRSTVRLRLSLLYGGLFLLSGAGLLAITYLLVAGDPVAPLLSASLRKGGLVITRGARPTSKSSLIQLVASADHAAQLHGLLIWSAVALCIMTVGSVWLGWLVAGRVLRPVRTITTMTRQMSEENLSERLALDGPDDDLKELGDTIDGLLARLERSFDAQRSFVANASHELRTPLTIMRAALDVAKQKDSTTLR